jgi:hypothetical protein
MDAIFDDQYSGSSGVLESQYAAPGTAAGATLTGTATLSAGGATGGTSGDASGATLTGTASLAPGAGAGSSSGAAAGATLTGTASLSPGSATAGGAPGAELTGTAILASGAAGAPMALYLHFASPVCSTVAFNSLVELEIA